MANVSLPALKHFLRHLTDAGETAALSDGELLARFRVQRDEAAFAALLQRHGPLVLGVCHRLLHNAHDAEDAFQATFLILVRKAHSVVKHGAVASWLHGVAHRVAVRLKGDNARRRQRERRAFCPPAPDCLQEILWCDLRGLLDEEVLRLPARCREPFVLCYLEGKTNEEAARLLGCPKGTVHSRLAHARALLRAALSRRGLTLSGGLLATMLPRPTAVTASAALLESTLRTALAASAPGVTALGAASTQVSMLAEGVLQTMLLSKIKAIMGVLLLAAVLAVGVGAPGWGYQTPAAPAAQASATAQPQADKIRQAGQADVRKRLRDPDPQVRLNAALALHELDEEAIGVLIDLLAVLPAPQRRLAEQALQRVAEEWSPTPALAGDDEISRRILRDAWSGWWRNAEGRALLAAFQKRTLSPAQTDRAMSLIADLGHKAFARRQHAAAELTALGLPVVPLLRQARQGADLEQARRLEQCLQQIARIHEHDALPAVAARLLALRKPAGATATLLAYLPFTDDALMQWEVRKALQSLAARSADAQPVLRKMLQAASPERRALAGETLAGVAGAEIRAAVRKLLADPDLTVRRRVAVALVCAADRQPLPVLIDLLADVPGDQLWQATEILYRVAGAKAPPLPSADGVAARQRYRDAWRAWYAAHGARAEWAPLPLPPPLLGFTTIAALAYPPDRTRSRVLEVDRNGKVRWQFTCHYPVDVRVLPGNRVLVSEYEGRRITERDFKGNILWQKTDIKGGRYGGPYNVQRLANRNTFGATGTHLLEFDTTGKTVFDRATAGSVAGCKLPDGQMIYLTDNGKCVRLDAAGKEVKRFHSGQNGDSGCVLDLTPWGSLLVSRSSKSAAEEFDLEGKSLWQAQGPGFAGISTAVRNGHMMVAIFSQEKVVQVDRSGMVVWQYQTAGYQPFLARQR